MTFLHSSDWHLGKSLFAKSLLEDQRAALDELTFIIESERPDVILLSGDLYDRSVPPEDAVKMLDQFLSKTILELKVPVVLIPGNHDSNTRVGVGAELLRASGLHVFATPESIHQPLRLETNGIKTSIYGVPYLEPSEWSFHFGKVLKTHEEALVAILESFESLRLADKAEGRRTVLLLHAYVTGGEPSESERPLSIGGSDLVSSELLGDFDYVALGHLHRPQKVSSERIRYPGSLFPYSQSEASQNKGAVIAKLGRSRDDDSFQFRAFEKTRKLHVVRGTLDELTNQTTTPQADDYIIAILTDESLPFEAFRRLNRIYPRLLHVARDVNWSRSAAEKADLEARSLKRDLSDRDVLAMFMTSVAQNEVSDEDREWLLQELEAFTKIESSEA